MIFGANIVDKPARKAYNETTSAGSSRGNVLQGRHENAKKEQSVPV